MTPTQRILTPGTAAMSPERRAAYSLQQREELVRLAQQGHHAAAWALEAIDVLLSDLARAQAAPAPPGDEPPRAGERGPGAALPGGRRGPPGRQRPAPAGSEGGPGDRA